MLQFYIFFIILVDVDVADTIHETRYGRFKFYLFYCPADHLVFIGCSFFKYGLGLCNKILHKFGSSLVQFIEQLFGIN